VEIELRRERAELPIRIAQASAKVEDLRGNGRREGDRELDAAVAEVRELSARERILPSLIAAAVSRRCTLEAQRLIREQAALTPERESLREEAQRAANEAVLAKRAAEDALVRLQGVEGRMDRLSEKARPFETFAQKAAEFEGKPQKILRLLSDAQHEGLLLPLAPLIPHNEENGA
jgi:hypothetical protein